MGDVCSSDASDEPLPSSSDYSHAVNIVLTKGRANARVPITNQKLATLRTNSLRSELAIINEARSEARRRELHRCTMDDLQMMTKALGVSPDRISESVVPQ